MSLRVALWGAAAAPAAAAPVVVFDIEPKGRRAQASGLDGAGGPVTAATRPSELGRIGGRGGRWWALVGRGEMWRRNRICQREWFAVARPIGGPQRRPLSSASTCRVLVRIATGAPLLAAREGTAPASAGGVRGVRGVRRQTARRPRRCSRRRPSPTPRAGTYPAVPVSCCARTRVLPVIPAPPHLAPAIKGPAPPHYETLPNVTDKGPPGPIPSGRYLYLWSRTRLSTSTAHPCASDFRRVGRWMRASPLRCLSVCLSVCLAVSNVTPAGAVQAVLGVSELRADGSRGASARSCAAGVPGCGAPVYINSVSSLCASPELSLLLPSPLL